MSTQDASVLKFGLANYYHSHIVQHSANQVHKNTQLLYGPMLDSLDQKSQCFDPSSDLSQKSHLLQRIQPRLIAIVTAAWGFVHLVVMLAERILFCLKEYTLMALYPQRRQWKLLPYILPNHLGELIRLALEVSSQILVQLIVMLHSPEKGMRLLLAKVESGEKDRAEMEQYSEKYSTFCSISMTDVDLKKNANNLAGKLFGNSARISVLWLAIRLMISLSKAGTSRTC